MLGITRARVVDLVVSTGFMMMRGQLLACRRQLRRPSQGRCAFWHTVAGTGVQSGRLDQACRGIGMRRVLPQGLQEGLMFVVAVAAEVAAKVVVKMMAQVVP